MSDQSTTDQVADAAAPAAAPAAAAPAAAAPAPAAPADYTLQLDGVLDADSVAEMKAAFKAAGVSQEQAQAHAAGLERAISTVNERAKAAAAKAAETTLRADPEFGGANYEKTLADAKAAAVALGGEEALKELDASGLGNSPALIKMFAKLAKSGVVKGEFVAGGNARDGGAKSVAAALYG